MAKPITVNQVVDIMRGKITYAQTQVETRSIDDKPRTSTMRKRSSTIAGGK